MESHGVLCSGITVKYAWIASNKAKWPNTLACDVFGVSASGYFEHWRRKKLDCQRRLNIEPCRSNIELGRVASF